MGKKSEVMFEYKQVIIIRNDLKMGKGKIAAQASHASVIASLNAKKNNSTWFDAWMRIGMKKIVVKVNSEGELEQLFQIAVRNKLPRAFINDAGHTQLAPGTATAAAIGPAPDSLIDPITKSLSLL
ncbi:MAG: peptidyl-tRNA hydrolase Pth2 [Candidatus Heimdallarchaeota archaeon]|nr:peptidyl-tRNA hydrolase Pth2 [Candidatus Heimdallarchaeota archaeon]MDH5647759.1 peptidyl-tRNA hydrolase Pth2 [Candidatus Heimdallarchaeota archaeon]